MISEERIKYYDVCFVLFTKYQAMKNAVCSDVLGQLVHTAIIAPPGKLLAIADYSAIECRCLAWLSGEKWVLSAFESGKDIYCETASRMYHVPVEKHGENGHLRQRGKQATLACGYSGGIGAIRAFAGDDISDSETQDIVDSWRAANRHTVNLWYALNNATKDAVMNGVRTSVRVGQGQKIVFRRTRHWLLVDLPDGRHLSYYKPRIGLNKFGTYTVSFIDAKTGIRIDAYGSSYAENITQALSRDLLCHSLNNLTFAGYVTMGHIHDEVLVEVDDESELDEICRFMCDAPS